MLEQAGVRGWDVLRLASDEVALDILPGLGGTVCSLTRADGRELLAATPWGLPRLGAPALAGSDHAVMLDSSPGGWEPLFPNVGDGVTAHGVAWPYDGEVRLTWLDATPAGSSLLLTGRLRRSPFEVSRTLSVQGAEVTLAETVRNVGGASVEVVWGNRLLLGGDLLAADTVLDTGASLVRPEPRRSSGTSYDDLLPWPRAYAEDGVVNLRSVPGRDAGVSRQAYLSDFDRPFAHVRRPSVGLGLELEWDAATWPFLCYALEAGGVEGYPWYGAGYHLALTPASSWPATGLHDVRRTSGTTVWIEPGTTRTATLTLPVTDGT